MNTAIELDSFDLVLALGIMGITIVLSLWQNLDLEKQLALGTGRSLLQLLVVGYVLDLVFALNNWLAVVGIILVMLSIAAITVRNRINLKIKGILPLLWLSLLSSTALTLGYIILVIIQPPRWYEPQYLIPLAGMILGNAMNGAALAGDRLVSGIKQHRLEIETHLALGATPKQAIFSYQKEAVRTGLIPILNNMMVVGLVSLPGMLTGQVIAGNNPLNAVSYQILILFALVGANLITTLLVTQTLYKKFFNHSMQLKIN